MNDATDVSLEADRLEELLEAPVPAQPVVMIEYRNRGVPWWMVGLILALVAVAGAIRVLPVFGRRAISAAGFKKRLSCRAEMQLPKRPLYVRKPRLLPPRCPFLPT